MPALLLRRLAALLVLLAAISALPSAQPVNLVVYATVETPPTSSTPAPLPAAVSFNEGRAVEVARISAGAYLVRFPGLDWVPNAGATLGRGGHVQVTGGRVEGSAAAAHCVLGSWSGNASGVELVVRCVRLDTGAAADAGFAVVGMRLQQVTSAAYVWLDTASLPADGSAYTPDRNYGVAPTGSPTIRRTGAGASQVSFPGLSRASDEGGHVLATTYQETNRRCYVNAWSLSTNSVVDVRCVNAAGAPQDARYSAAILTRAFLGAGDVYLWANGGSQPDPYTPNGIYTGTATPRALRVSRASAGRYEVRIPRAASTDGHVGGFKVTAYGSDAVCALGGIASDAASGALTVTVFCDGPTGAPADAQFFLTRLTRQFLPVSGESGPGADALGLEPPAPNPARGAARLPVTLPEAADARVAVIDLLGREVAVLHEGPLTAGRTDLALPAGLAPGVYVARVASGGAVAARRFVVVR